MGATLRIMGATYHFMTLDEAEIIDAAFECFRRSIDERDAMMCYIKVHPMFDAFRADPCYPELVRRMNL